MNEPKGSISRRNALKILAAATGASALTLLPKTWKKPVVGVGALPAFAQGSLGTGDFQATLTWDTGIPIDSEGSPVDLDLHVFEPDGTHVYYANPVGVTATLDFDNTWGFGPENIFVPDGGVADGDYEVHIVYWNADVEEYPATHATIRVRTFVGSGLGQTKTYHRTVTTPSTSTLIPVANANYPSGNITELTTSRRMPANAKTTK